MIASSTVFILFLFISSTIYPDDINNNSQQKYGQLSEGETLKEIDKYNVELMRNDISVGERSKMVLKINILYNSIGRYDKSVQILEEFISNYKGAKEEPHLLLILGMGYVMLGEIERASNSFTEIIIKYPDDKIVKYAKEELERLKDRNFINLMDEGHAELSYIKNLTIIKGWYFVIRSITKSSIYKFLIIGCFILLANKLQLINSLKSKSFISKQNCWGSTLLMAVIFVFTQPLFRILYLFAKYGVKGHFSAFTYFVDYLISGTRDIYIIDFLSGVIGMAFILYLLKRENISFKHLFFKDVPYLKNIFLTILFIIGAHFTFKYLWVVLIKMFSYKESIQQILFSLCDKRYFFAYVYIGIMTPLIQELFFRGIFLQTLLEKIKLPYAIILSSLVFSLYYLNFDLPQLLFLFVYGSIFALIYKRFGVFSCFTMHSILVLLKM